MVVLFLDPNTGMPLAPGSDGNKGRPMRLIIKRMLFRELILSTKKLLLMSNYGTIASSVP
jgi:hypothetical protein